MEEGLLPVLTEEAKYDPEDLFPDGMPDGGCSWVRAYWGRHKQLIAQAKAITKDGEQKAKQIKEDPEEQRKEEEKFKESLNSIQAHVWSLCPKEPLVIGIVSSLLLTASSFATPYITGKLYDSAIEASRTTEHDTGQVSRYLVYVGGLVVWNYIGE